MDFFINYVKQMSDKINAVDSVLLNQATHIITGASRQGGKVIVAGNGGSAAIASHVSVDLTLNTTIRAINFNEAALITCFANDFGYENWVQKAIEFYAQENDIVILISSRGQSKNIINGALKTKEMGLELITFSGFTKDNPLRKIGDINFWVDSDVYNIVEMAHHIWLLAIVDKIVESTRVMNTMVDNQAYSG
jgi:D-sedoheptulose 7-phosphate isomerase